MDGREDESSGQVLQVQLLPGVEEAVEPRLVILDDTVCPVVWALCNQTAGVSGEKTVVVPQVEPLGVPSSVVR